MRNLLNATAAGDVKSVNQLVNKIVGLIRNLMGPILIVVGAAAAVYAIYLGVMYAKAEDANKRKEVQGRLIGAVIGVVIIVVGVTLCYAIDWQNIVTSWSQAPTSSV